MKTYTLNLLQSELREIGIPEEDVKNVLEKQKELSENNNPDNFKWPNNDNLGNFSGYFKDIGYVCFCPNCQKMVPTTRCTCMCGNCKICGYRWSCIPPFTPQQRTFTVDLPVGWRCK